MRSFVLAFLACAGALVAAQTNQMFRANIVLSDPTGNSFTGSVTGVMHYGYVTNNPDNTIVRIDYDPTLQAPGVVSQVSPGSGPVELYNYAADERYLVCDVCERETWTEPPFEFLRLPSDTMGGTMSINGVTCTEFTKSNVSPNGVTRVFVDTNNGDRICRADLNSGLVYTFSNFAATTQANLNIFTSFTGCPEPTCGTFVDLALVLDESGSISGGDFDLEQEFAVDVVDRFNLDRMSGAQVCIIFYDEDVALVQRLSVDRQSINNAILGRSQARGFTATGSAMVTATTELTGNNNRQRPNAAKLMIVITDGQTNRGTAVADAANIAEQAGVIRIAVGVGPNVNTNDIENVIPTPPAQVGGARTSFLINDFNELNAALSQIVAVTCRPLNGNQCGSGCLGFCTCGQVCVCPNVCDDGNMCTNDFCTAGQNGNGCQFAPRVCNDNNQCTQDTCNTATGCVYTDISSNCDDGNACTNNVCQPASGCTFPPITCNDNDVCTDDSCNPSMGCQYTLVAMGNCLCQGVTCPQPDLPCGEYVCQNNDGMCDFIPTICDDGDMCTTETCVDAVDMCVFTPVSCDDGNACTDDTCIGTSGCMNVAFDVAERCDDGTVCTTDTCEPASGCVNTDVVCDDSDVCTVDSCNSVMGCQNDPRNCAEEEEIARILEESNDGTPCYTATCDPELPDGCRLLLITNATIDSCGVCNGDDSTCGDGLDNTDLAAISGGVIAALVIAACLLCLLLAVASGKGGYDVYLKGKNAMDSATTNPLYDNGGLEGTNPMHEI